MGNNRRGYNNQGKGIRLASWADSMGNRGEGREGDRGSCGRGGENTQRKESADDKPGSCDKAGGHRSWGLKVKEDKGEKCQKLKL